jgi:hypothetical protein
MQSARNQAPQARLDGNSVSDSRYSHVPVRSRRLNLRGSNRQFLTRLESPLTSTKQTPERISNRHVWASRGIMFTALTSSDRISNRNISPRVAVSVAIRIAVS